MKTCSIHHESKGDLYPSDKTLTQYYKYPRIN